MIKAELKMLSTSIDNVLTKIDKLSIAQLNEMPEGFSNNIIWNVAHLMVVQKLLIYGLSDNETNLEEVILNHYKKGAKPQYRVVQEEIDYVKAELKKFVPQLEIDIKKNIFKNYKAYLTSYNFEITNFNEAVVMVNLHYGLHVGTILKMLKKV